MSVMECIEIEIKYRKFNSMLNNFLKQTGIRHWCSEVCAGGCCSGCKEYMLGDCHNRIYCNAFFCGYLYNYIVGSLWGAVQQRFITIAKIHNIDNTRGEMLKSRYYYRYPHKILNCNILVEQRFIDALNDPELIRAIKGAMDLAKGARDENVFVDWGTFAFRVQLPDGTYRRLNDLIFCTAGKGKLIRGEIKYTFSHHQNLVYHGGGF